MTSQQQAPVAMGLRHVALRVRDLEVCERFYVELMGYHVEWRPDPDNVYLSQGQDNLALHREADFEPGKGPLDHMGIAVAKPEQVDAWYQWLSQAGVSGDAPPRTHRDGARSFYTADPEGNRIQLLYHPPIVAGSLGR